MSESERRKIPCLSEDRVENLIRISLDEYTSKVEKTISNNIEIVLANHINKIEHLTSSERALIYDAKNYIDNQSNKSATLKWLFTMPLVGLLAERVVSYLIHKHP